MEMRSRWRTHWRGATIRVYLIIDQTPLLQESMDPEMRRKQEVIEKNGKRANLKPNAFALSVWNPETQDLFVFSWNLKIDIFANATLDRPSQKFTK